MASTAFPSKTLAALLCSLTCTLAAHAQDVVFVQIASQTNPASKDNAKGMAVGIQAYFDAVNAKGGIQGHKLALKIKDDDLNAENMLKLTKESIAEPEVVACWACSTAPGWPRWPSKIWRQTVASP